MHKHRIQRYIHVIQYFFKSLFKPAEENLLGNIPKKNLVSDIMLAGGIHDEKETITRPSCYEIIKRFTSNSTWAGRPSYAIQIIQTSDKIIDIFFQLAQWDFHIYGLKLNRQKLLSFSI